MEASSEQQARIRRGQSRASSAVAAVREFHAAVAQRQMALVVFFCSSAYDLDAIAAEMNRLFAGVDVVGCTSTGEIGPAGYVEHSLCGASFPAGQFTAVCACLDQLQEFAIPAGQALAKDLLQRSAQQRPPTPGDNSFALLLIDGLSVREEPVARSVQSALTRIPLLGGSASDGIHGERTQVFHAGRFASDRAVVALLTTRLPIKLFQTHHFVATDERLVVTAADSAHRIVHEINGRPAAQEYARLVGMPVDALTSEVFSATPVVVLTDGASYVRSIRRANADGSLTFFCAIDNGLILRLARAGDLYHNLAATFAEVRDEIGAPQLVIACDCVVRRPEILRSADRQRVIDLLQANNCTGFCTYGEQYRGIHLNQTLAGVAIGEAGAGAGATRDV